MKPAMNETQTQALEKLIRNVLNLDPGAEVANLVSADCPAWDSLRHVELVLKIQSQFQIKFSSGEMVMLRSVAEIKNLINAHLRAQN
jgi:acyl carrier protein